MRKLLIVAATIAVMFVNAGAERAPRFVPPAGKILLIMGQNAEDIREAVLQTHVTPAGFMTYTSITMQEGLDLPFNQGDGTQFAQGLITDYPHTVLQIGLWMVDDCGKVADGQLDNELDKLAEWIQNTKRPVYLRVGYEFDGPHNHYPPADYVRAFRYLVKRFRERGVENVAYVWHSYASRVTRPLIDWYPGDDYVDWVGISYFNQSQYLMQPVIDLAHRHKKPIMIAESSPWTVQTKSANSWNLWFVPLFKFMEANHIQAFSYISCDWDAMEQFKNQKWGDTRLKANPIILKEWINETKQDRYLKASPELYKQLGYSE